MCQSKKAYESVLGQPQRLLSTILVCGVVALHLLSLNIPREEYGEYYYAQNVPRAAERMPRNQILVKVGVCGEVGVLTRVR